MDLGALIAEAREVLDELTISPPLIPLASLKRKGNPAQHYGGTKVGEPKAATAAGRPSNVGKPGGDSTKAGVKPKELSKTFKKRDFQKTQATPAAKKPSGSGDKPPSCPGGQAPRMVFGKWRCSAPTSKGAKQAKSRIAAKRQKKGQKKAAPKGTLAKLVHKARKALVGLFK